MRWARFEMDGEARYGIVGEVDSESMIEEVSGDPFGTYKKTGKRHTLSSVKLLCPVAPRTVYAAGLNYAAHVTALADRNGETPKLPGAADIGYRGANALIAHGEQIVIPKDAGERIQYEAELVVVIGQKAKGLSEVDALSCVLGYTIGNDVSERAWQASDRTLWRAKSTDTFMPMGPWIETDLNLESAMTRVRLNGRQTLEFPTNSMIFGVAHYISRMSKYMTLHPGDVIWMGTEGISENLKAGDFLDIEITGIGTLSNPIVRASVD